MFIPCVLVGTVQLRANGWAPCIKWSTLEAWFRYPGNRRPFPW